MVGACAIWPQDGSAQVLSTNLGEECSSSLGSTSSIPDTITAFVVVGDFEWLTMEFEVQYTLR